MWLSPTVRQRELGTLLRQLRKGRGLTFEEVGEQLPCSATKISRIETGHHRPSPRGVRKLCSDLDRYREALEHLRDEALSPPGSIALVAAIQRDYAENSQQ